MAIRIIYITLLFLMILVLFYSGQALKKNYRIFSNAGIAALSVYTINEGLRFGRGIDYSLYWRSYDQFAAGWDSSKEIAFDLLRTCFIYFGSPFQALVIFMSFMFILGLLSIMRQYRNILPIALPLFALYSLYEVENMVRWYLAYSIFLIGLSYLLEEGKINRKFIYFSGLACLFHYAFVPIPIIFYFVYRNKGILFRPFISFSIFLAVYLFFETEIMLSLTEPINFITASTGTFENYSDRAEYWLTSGYADNYVSGILGWGQILFLFTVTFAGYKPVQKLGRNYIFAYNLFIIGMILLPIAKKIELVLRYQQTFYFFQAVVIAASIYMHFIWKRVKLHYLFLCSTLLIYLNSCRIYVSNPLNGNIKKYMYVWDKTNENYYSILNIYLNDQYKSSLKQKRK